MIRSGGGREGKFLGDQKAIAGGTVANRAGIILSGLVKVVHNNIRANPSGGNQQEETQEQESFDACDLHRDNTAKYLLRLLRGVKSATSAKAGGRILTLLPNLHLLPLSVRNERGRVGVRILRNEMSRIEP